MVSIPSIIALRGCASVVAVDKATSQVSLTKSKSAKEPPKLFTYDSVFGIEATQRSIYDESGFPLIESVLEGYNGINERMRSARDYICIWTNGLWEDVHDAGR